MKEAAADPLGPTRRTITSPLVRVIGPRLGPLELKPRASMAEPTSQRLDPADDRNLRRAAEVVSAFVDEEIGVRSCDGPAVTESAVAPDVVTDALLGLAAA